jgi:hypothetical protein
MDHRYPARELTGDYARAGAGLVATMGPLLFVPASPVMIWLLGGLAALFLAFGARTALRQITVVRLDDAGITAIGPMGATIAWDDLGRLALAYYSTRRDRSRGWMQLSVKGRGRGVRVDSTIDGFRDIAAAAAREAERKGLSLTPATIGNLAALGIEMHQATADRPDAQVANGSGHA